MVAIYCNFTAVAIFRNFARRRSEDYHFEIVGKRWWALVNDLRTLSTGQIVAGIPQIRDLTMF